MGDIRFQSDQTDEFQRTVEFRDLTQKLVDWKLVSSRQAARNVLIVVIVLVIGLAFTIVSSSKSEPEYVPRSGPPYGR